jgi:ribosomal protein L21E
VACKKGETYLNKNVRTGRQCERYKGDVGRMIDKRGMKLVMGVFHAYKRRKWDLNFHLENSRRRPRH